MRERMPSLNPSHEGREIMRKKSIRGKGYYSLTQISPP